MLQLGFPLTQGSSSAFAMAWRSRRPEHQLVQETSAVEELERGLEGQFDPNGEEENRLKADRYKTRSSEVRGQRGSRKSSSRVVLRAALRPGGVPLESLAVGTLLGESHFSMYHLTVGKQAQSHTKSRFEKCSPKC